jgi:hypothetical protein
MVPVPNFDDRAAGRAGNGGVWDREFVTNRQGEARESTDILASEPAADIAPARIGANT